MAEKMKIEAVLFDMDGVLIDTEKYLTRFWRQAAAEHGLTLTEEDACRFRSFSSKYAAPWFAETFGEEYDYWAIRERRKELMSEHLKLHGVEKKEGVDEVLHALRSAGVKTAVVTATEEKRARQYLEEIGILHLFDDVICADMVERGKPFPDIYLSACGKIHRKPEQCAAVEDSPNGVRSASAAGCHVIMVPDLTEPDEETWAVLEARADSIREVPDLIRNMGEKDGGIR